MKHEIKAPTVGESITEVSILKWAKPNGAQVKNGETLLEIESDKATVEIVAEATGALTIGKNAGERVKIGAVIGFIDDSVKGTASASAPAAAPKASAPSAPAPAQAAAPAAGGSSPGLAAAGPGVRRMAAQHGINVEGMSGSGRGGRVTKGDLINGGGQTAASVAPAPTPTTKTHTPTPLREGERRAPMSMLRQKIAERLVQAQHTAAILTTFNEADMTAIMDLRKKHKEAFQAKHGVPLSFMSFFTKASVAALKAIPEVNARVDGTDIIYADFYDVGIAVGSDRGLVVPVIRGADKLSFADMEKKMAELAGKARDGKLGIADMTGGTFTISNGGTYGSLLSTPILNMPQAGILGMHKIQDRPMAMDGKVVVRPMMYLALSYDHRIIDGKGAVTFLVTLKDHLEHPEKLGLDFV